MALYTYGGTPADVLTTRTGDVVPDYPVLVRVAGTGQLVTALYEADGTTPIGELRTNSTTSSAPGAIRTFKVPDTTAIEFEYLDAVGTPVRWYAAAREASTGALDQIEAKLDKAGGTLTGAVQSSAVNADDVVFASFKAGDAYDRWRQTADGGQTWGSGTAQRDTSLYRSGPGVLETPGLFVPGQISLNGMKIFNPRAAFGAKGDGIADDAPAVQAALDAASFGGGWVIVPPGDYRLATLPLRTWRKTRLTLMPGARFIRAADSTVLTNGAADQTYGGYTGHGDIVIEGGVWEMQGTAAGLTASRMCISLGHAQNITIRDVTVRDLPGYHAIEINAIKTAKIIGCSFLGYIDPGSRDFSEAIQLDLAKGSAYFGAFGPADDTPCVDVLIDGCTVGPSGTPGTTSWPRGIGSHSASPGKPHRDVRIKNSRFEGCSQFAIGAYTYEGLVIEGVQMRDCGGGVRVRTLDSSTASHRTPAGGSSPTITGSQPLVGFTISDMTFVGGGSYGAAVHVEGEDTGFVGLLSLDSITIKSCAGNGLRLISVEDYSVRGVTVVGSGGTGWSTLGTRRGRWVGCHVNGATNAGMTLDSRSTAAATATDVTVAQCSVTATGANGFHIYDGADILIDDCDAYALTGYGVQISTATNRPVIRNVRTRATTLAGINITSTVTNVRRYGNVGTIADASTTPTESSPYDSAQGSVEDALAVPGRYESRSRLRSGSDAGLTSGWLYLVPVWLPKGIIVSNLTFVSGGTAATTPTNQWFALFDANRVALARTADATTAAWAAATAKTLAIAQTTAGSATSYTTTYTGLHYYGVMVAAATPPSMLGEGRLSAGASTAPGFGATNSGMTAPPTVTAGAFTAAAFSTAAILAYAYAA